MAFTNILSLLGDIGSWLLLPLNFIFLTIDGIVYSLVAYSYKLFMLMAKLNFNSMLTWFSPIISRVNTLIAVLVMFVIAYNLIQYLINPDKASDRNSGGVAIIKNIAIAALLLIVYNFAFSLINEFTFILVGAPDGYKYSALFDTFGVENTDGDPGLIQRLILGSGSNSEEINDFGNTLAVGTLNIFLHGNEENVNLEEVTDSSYIGKIYSIALSNKNSFNMMFVTAAAPEVGRSVEYKWPIISTAVGAYLVYTIVTISIAIGVRAFKLVALQVLAPIAIVTIIKDGTGGRVWKAYLSVLGKTYIDVFIRVAAMLFTTAFISVAWRNIGTLYTTDENSVTKFLLLILVIVAGFKFAKDLPAFIDSVFGSKLAENNKNGFKNFATGALGFAAGGISGFASGLSSAKANGLSGRAAFFNAMRSGVQGSSSGAKAKSIKDAFKNAGDASSIGRKNAESMKAHGGRISDEIRYGFGEMTGANYRNDAIVNSDIKKIDAQIRDANNAHTMEVEGIDDGIASRQRTIKYESEKMARQASSKKYSDGSDINFGSSKESFAQTVAENDNEYREAMVKVEMLKGQIAAGQDRSKDLLEAEAKAARLYREAEKSALEEYDAARTDMGITNLETDVKRLEEQRQTLERNHRQNIRQLEASKEELSKKIINKGGSN